MRNCVFISLVLFLVDCSPAEKKVAAAPSELNTLIDNWHKAAANAQFNTYFNALSEDAIFIGTDARERWSKKHFEDYSKPYFDKGKAWTFASLERHWYFNQDSTVVWFDELLDTQMKLCRGSGVLTQNNNKEWKITQYVLSMTVPNEVANEVIAIKDSIETAFSTQLKNL
jgi:hypothetical protein